MINTCKTMIRREAGFTFTEILVSSGILLVLFLGIFPLLIVTTQNTTTDRNRIAAVNAAQRKIEYLRNLDYDSIGAEANANGMGYLETNLEAPGYTPGVDPLLTDQVELSAGIFARRTVFILWADDPADGVNAMDTDNNTHDYKHVIVQLDWKQGGQDHNLILRSFIEGQSLLDTGGGDHDEQKKTKPVKPKKTKEGKGKMGKGAKAIVDPSTSNEEPPIDGE
jgi:hypothetical protein